MDLDAAAELSHSPDQVFAAVADLGTYPRWLGIVNNVVPDPNTAAAWHVDLQGGIGPIRRTKRVRMVRVVEDAPRKVAFERDEADGREHAAWVLTADLVPSAAGTRLRMHLFYGGSRWLPGLDLLLRREVTGAGDRLDGLLGQPQRFTRE